MVKEESRKVSIRRKAMTKLDSIPKSRDIILLTKVRIIEAMVFQSSCTNVSWTVKKAEF